MIGRQFALLLFIYFYIFAQKLDLGDAAALCSNLYKMAILCDNLMMLFGMLMEAPSTEACHTKICDFCPTCSYVSEMTEDRDIVTMEDLYDVQGDLPNGDIVDEFECPLKVISGTAYIFYGQSLARARCCVLPLLTKHSTATLCKHTIRICRGMSRTVYK